LTAAAYRLAEADPAGDVGGHVRWIRIDPVLTWCHIGIFVPVGRNAHPSGRSNAAEQEYFGITTQATEEGPRGPVAPDPGGTSWSAIARGGVPAWSVGRQYRAVVAPSSPGTTPHAMARGFGAPASTAADLMSPWQRELQVDAERCPPLSGQSPPECGVHRPGLTEGPVTRQGEQPWALCSGSLR